MSEIGIVTKLVVTWLTVLFVFFSVDDCMHVIWMYKNVYKKDITHEEKTHYMLMTHHNKSKRIHAIYELVVNIFFTATFIIITLLFVAFSVVLWFF